MKEKNFQTALLMIAVCRLVFPTVNIAAATALQAIKPDGREEALLFGANIIMPQITPVQYKKEYVLYEGKPCLEESAIHCKSCLEDRINRAGREVGRDSWGDSLHFAHTK